MLANNKADEVTIVEGDDDEGATEEEVAGLIDDTGNHGTPMTKPLGQRKFIIITTGIIVFGFMIAMVIDELETGQWSRGTLFIFMTDIPIWP